MWKKHAAFLAAAAVAAVAFVTCDSVPLTAPAGSTLFAQVNPPFVVANGGTAVVTVVVTEPAGTPVPNGTVVYFFSDLGHVDETVKTRDGIAHANFVADSRSGHATIVISSGAASGGGGTPTTTTTLAGAAPPPAISSAGLTASVHSIGAAPRPWSSTSTASGTGSVQLVVDIGSALPAKVFVTASPQRITSPRRATIIANVFDQFGNPVQNVPVIFTITGASLLEETLASGGSPQYTDSNGQAFDTLNTRAPIGVAQKIVTVTATTANGVQGTATVAID
jgi:hypothetical protein